jgi:hypothetical protein
MTSSFRSARPTAPKVAGPFNAPPTKHRSSKSKPEHRQTRQQLAATSRNTAGNLLEIGLDWLSQQSSSFMAACHRISVDEPGLFGCGCPKCCAHRLTCRFVAFTAQHDQPVALMLIYRMFTKLLSWMMLVHPYRHRQSRRDPASASPAGCAATTHTPAGARPGAELAGAARPDVHRRERLLDRHTVEIDTPPTFAITRPCRTRRGSSTTGKAASAGSPPASPPTPPDVRVR